MSSQLAGAHGPVACAMSPTTVMEPDSERRASMRSCIGERSCTSSTTMCPKARTSSSDPSTGLVAGAGEAANPWGQNPPSEATPSSLRCARARGRPTPPRAEQGPRLVDERGVPHRPRDRLERVAAGPVEALHLRRARDCPCPPRRAAGGRRADRAGTRGARAGATSGRVRPRPRAPGATAAPGPSAPRPRAPRRSRTRCGPASPGTRPTARGGPAPPRSAASRCGCPAGAGPWRRCRRSSGPAAAAHRHRRGPRRRGGAGVGGCARPASAP